VEVNKFSFIPALLLRLPEIKEFSGSESNEQRLWEESVFTGHSYRVGG
jgi:hypothetical protein